MRSGQNDAASAEAASTGHKADLVLACLHMLSKHVQQGLLSDRPLGGGNSLILHQHWLHTLTVPTEFGVSALSGPSFEGFAATRHCQNVLTFTYQHEY